MYDAKDPTLTHLAPHFQDKTFSAEGYVGLGVPLGTDTSVQDFATDKIKDIIDDVDKLDTIEDGFIHYQLLRFCQATRLQYRTATSFSITRTPSNNNMLTLKSLTPSSRREQNNQVSLGGRRTAIG